MEAAQLNMTYEVQLAIYDLSQGMARSLSSQFLGPNHAIDVIPHTGILVFGKEYYFGGNGIECSDPNHFRSTRGMFPIQIQNVGRTRISQSEFEAWCRRHGTRGGMFSNSSYDLFHRNCNNFSQHAITEGLSLTNASVPEWVLEVPRRVLASPMGQLIQPIMEQMQITGPTGGHGGVNFGSDNFGSDVNPWASNALHINSPNDNLTNPWANIMSSSRSSTTNNTSSSIPSTLQPTTFMSTTGVATNSTRISSGIESKYSQEQEENILKVLSFIHQAQRDHYR